jgi:hypothetical protein
MKRIWFVGVLGVTVLMAAAQPAAAGWLQQSTPSPAGLVTSVMNGVSCPTVASCTAVGSYTDGSGEHPLAEASAQGTNWTLQSVPVPVGSSAGELNAVVCRTKSSCVAVGDDISGSGQQALSEVWNGSSWAAGSVPEPGGATAGQLNGVSCISASRCTAVGNYTDAAGQYALVEASSGGVWSITTIPLPAGATGSQLSGVSCPSANTCTAAGTYFDTTGEHALVETSSGSTWTVQAVPGPSGSTSTSLDAVSCIATNACTVVGYHQADGWDGTVWALQKVPTPRPHSSLTTLLGVSCVSSTACSAAGSYYVDGVLTGVAEMWNGTKWIVQDTPLDTSSDSSGLAAVSCKKADLCSAVGFYHDPVDGNRAWVESFALRWQVQDITPPATSIASGLTAISCTSPIACMAVDSYETGSSTFGTSAQRWDGSGWTDLSTPNSLASLLSGVSCTAADACTAVGDVLSGSELEPLAERWDGTSWIVQTTPAPSGSTSSYLLAVSCTSPVACTAVGAYRTGSGHQFTLAESWNGSRWILDKTPNPTGTTTDTLNWISCPTSSTCEAVGAASPDTSGVLVEARDGSSWQLRSAPLPSGGTDGYLSGVDCTSTSACTAVGDYFNGSSTVPLVERWQGTTWNHEAVAAPEGAEASGLEGVSCASSTNCNAVGYADNSSGLTPIGKQWNGTKWTMSTASVPPGSPSAMVSVSCPTTTFCEGVGYYTPSGGSNTDLAEQWS